MKQDRSTYEQDYLDWYNDRSGSRVKPGNAHAASFGNRASVEASTRVGCFYCQRIFHPALIHRWTLERIGKQTAWCPHCGIDSILGNATGFPITPAFLGRMRQSWFGERGPTRY